MPASKRPPLPFRLFLYQNVEKAGSDIVEALKSRKIYTQLAWRELCSHYDRTFLGMIWVVVSPLLHIALLGGIFYIVLNQPPNYLSYFSTSWIIWTLVRQAISDGATLWPRATPYVTNMRLPLTLFFLTATVKNMLLCSMILPIAFAGSLLFGDGHSPSLLLQLIPGFALFYLNLLWIIVFLSIVCLRYQDLVALIPHGLFVLQFATPIFWPTARLQNHRWIAEFNPFFHLLEITRGPLIGQSADALSWQVAIGCALAGNLFALTLFCFTRRKLVLWML